MDPAEDVSQSNPGDSVLPRLEDMPPEIHHHILSNLDMSDFMNYESVCKRIRRVTMGNYLHLKHIISNNSGSCQLSKILPVYQGRILGRNALGIEYRTPRIASGPSHVNELCEELNKVLELLETLDYRSMKIAQMEIQWISLRDWFPKFTRVSSGSLRDLTVLTNGTRMDISLNNFVRYTLTHFTRLDTLYFRGDVMYDIQSIRALPRVHARPENVRGNTIRHSPSQLEWESNLTTLHIESSSVLEVFDIDILRHVPKLRKIMLTGHYLRTGRSENKYLLLLQYCPELEFIGFHHVHFIDHTYQSPAKPFNESIKVSPDSMCHSFVQRIPNGTREFRFFAARYYPDQVHRNSMDVLSICSAVLIGISLVPAENVILDAISNKEFPRLESLTIDVTRLRQHPYNRKYKCIFEDNGWTKLLQRVPHLCRITLTGIEEADASALQALNDIYPHLEVYANKVT